MKMNKLITLLVTMAAIQLSVHAQEAIAKGGGGRTNLTQDARFVTQAAQAEMFDIQLGQLAANTSSNADVVALGQQVQSDQTDANNQLSTIASNDGFTMPTDLDTSHQRALDKFSKLSGKKFDKAFARQIAVSSTQQVKFYNVEASKGTNTDLQTFATNESPILQDHATAAKQLAKEIK